MIEKICNMKKIRWQSIVKFGSYVLLFVVGVAMTFLFPLYSKQLQIYGTIGLVLLLAMEVFTVICGDKGNKINYFCGVNSLMMLGLWVYYAFFSQI